MKPGLLECITLFSISTVAAWLIIRLTSFLAHTRGILDRPGQHKQHKHVTPCVGGFGIFAALFPAFCFLTSYYTELFERWMGLGISSLIIFVMGFIDDIFHLNYKIRLVVQAAAVLVMILVSEVMLADLGKLLPAEILALPAIAIPFTLFAVIGGINAVNMIDGIDGLSGSVSLVSLILLGTVAFIADNQPSLIITIALAGGVTGFLFFNLRHPLQRRATVFLGDNGSMLLGFLITWLLIELSQGSNRSMTPVTALWLFSIPLMDTVGVILRRVWQHKSPFEPDHNHLHHVLLHAGYRVTDTVFAIVLIHLLFGVIGVVSLYLRVDEHTMLTLFLLCFSGYFYLSLHPRYLIAILRKLHTFLGLIPVQSHNLLLGRYSEKEAENLVYTISKELRSKLDSLLVHVIKNKISADNEETQYAVIITMRLDLAGTSTEKDKIMNSIELMQEHLYEIYDIQLHPFDRRVHDHGHPYRNRRLVNIRKSSWKLLTFEATYIRDSIAEQDFIE